MQAVLLLHISARSLAGSLSPWSCMPQHLALPTSTHVTWRDVLMVGHVAHNGTMAISGTMLAVQRYQLS